MSTIQGLGNLFRRRTVLLLLVGGIVCCVAGVPDAAAQDVADLHFRSIDATAGEPCRLDRLTLHMFRTTMTELADVEPNGPQITLGTIPIHPARSYIVTAWYRDVPYFWDIRGRDLAADTTVVHVFQTTAATDSVAVAGMTLLFKKQDSLAVLEYNLQVENRNAPQRTVVGEPATITLPVPAAAVGFQAFYYRGPNPTEIPVLGEGTGRIGLAVPLTHGMNRIRVEARAEWREGFELPVGCSLPVRAWSLLATPESLEAESFDLEPTLEGEIAGYRRFIGEPLTPGDEFAVRFSSTPEAGPQANVFTTAADSAAENAATDESAPVAGRRGPPALLLALAAALIILVYLAVRFRKRSED